MPLFGSSSPAESLVHTDLHNHLLPGLDDGAKDFEHSKRLIVGLGKLGLHRFVVTPHIMHDYYRNSPDDVRRRAEELRQYLQKEGVEAEIIDGGEYYLDEHFADKVANKTELLSFGKQRYVLVETAFMNKPVMLKQTFFELLSQGYQPIFAHPERYSYVAEDTSLINELTRQGVLMQLNVNSITGYYGGAAKKLAQKLVKAEMIHFLGSDCHHERHIDQYGKALRHKAYRTLSGLNLLNDHIAA